MAAQEIQVADARILLIRGDITEQDVDAIVNAANPSLLGGGGVDGAIHRKGGKKILEECKRIRATEWPSGLPIGKAVATSAGNMKARYVIHTVGPVWHGGNHGEPELLAETYRSSLRLAASMKLKTLAFPSISTGAYGYPIDKASLIALSTVEEFLKKENMLETIVFVLFTEHDLEIYRKTAEEILTEKAY